jgi:hypothetical protein
MVVFSIIWFEVNLPEHDVCQEVEFYGQEAKYEANQIRKVEE